MKNRTKLCFVPVFISFALTCQFLIRNAEVFRAGVIKLLFALNLQILEKDEHEEAI